MTSERPLDCERLSEEQMELFYYDELPEPEAAVVRGHLEACPACRERWTGLQAWLDSLREAAPEPGEDLVARSRLEFHRRLVQVGEASRRGVAAGPVGSWRFWAGAVAAGLLLFTVGLAIGRHLAGGLHFAADPAGLLDHPELYTTTTQISYDPDREVLNLEILATRRFQISGSARDPAVARLLARSVLASKNPAVRRQAVELLGELEAEGQEVESAIIAALTTDPNPAVRTRALEVILHRPVTAPARQALIDVLLNDRNLALRLRALEGLSQWLDREHVSLPPPEVSRLLQVAEYSDSSLLRRRTYALLQGMDW